MSLLLLSLFFLVAALVLEFVSGSVFWEKGVRGCNSNTLIDKSIIDRSNIESGVGSFSGVVKVDGGKTLNILCQEEDVEVRISGEVVPVDLIICSMELYDVILVMDWLWKCRANIDYHRSRVTFEREEGKLLYQGIRSTWGSLVISTLQAEKMIEKSCEVCLVTIMTPETVGEVSVKNIKESSLDVNSFRKRRKRFELLS